MVAFAISLLSQAAQLAFAFLLSQAAQLASACIRAVAFASRPARFRKSSPARFRFHRRPRPLPQAVLGTFASQLSFLQAVPVALASSPGSFRSHTSIHALSQGFAVQRLLGVGCERRYSTAGRVEHWRLRRPRRAPDWPVCCRSFVLVLGSGAVDTVLPSVPSVRLSVRCSATGSLTANAHRNPHVAGPPQCGE